MKWPEILLGVYVLYALWKGYHKGLVGVLLDWVGFLLALVLVYALFAGGTAILERFLPPAMIREGGKALALLLVVVAVRVGFWALSKASGWMARKIGLELPYRLLGAFLQVLQGLALWSVLAAWIAGFEGGEIWFRKMWPWSGWLWLESGRALLAVFP